MKKFNLLLLLIIASFSAFAQSAGSILGKVTDENGKPLEFATIKVYDGGSVVGGSKSDALGKYEVKPVAAGSYTVKLSYTGYVPEEVSNVSVSNGNGTTVNFKLEKGGGKTIKGVTISKKRENRPAMIDENKAGQPPGIVAKQIEKLSTNNTISAAALRPGTYQKKEGSGLSLGGAREGNTSVMVDGVMVKDQSRVQLPKGSVEQIDVNVSGLSANLGDALGGVVQLTTKGASAKTTGSIDVQHSFDGYNNNQINANIRGPLLKLKDSTGAKTRTVLGYQLASAVQYDVDGDPAFNGYYKLDPSKYDALYNQPLVLSPAGTGAFTDAANFLRKDDFIKIRSRENAATKIASLQGKLVYSPTEYVTVTLGGNGIYNNSQAFSLANTLFSSQANAATKALTGRGYVRLRQSLDKSKNSTPTLISKAYYIVQLSYEKNFNSTENAKHKKNVFDYAYLGKFHQDYASIYVYDTANTKYKGLRFLQDAPAGITFTPDYNYNPSLINYTQAVLNIDPNYSSIQAFQQGTPGLINGEVPSAIYNNFTNIGSQVNVYSKSESDQASINLDASFDLKPNYNKQITQNKEVARHAIEFGMYYDQRITRSYGLVGVGNNGIWNAMRGVANAHIALYDYSNPIFRHNGQDYTEAELLAAGIVLSGFDSINYKRIYDGSAQSYFDKNLRQKLGLPVDGFDILNIDEIDHKLYTLDMFSADDLLNKQAVAYSGYDYLGNKTKGRASFEDFWKKKDANGNFSREVAPFNPIYVAGYIQDNFKFRDLRFRLGLRLDRYDANNKVLRDPYSFFGTRTVKDLVAGQFQLTRNNATGLDAPNPTSDADFIAKHANDVVYVDDNNATNPKIIGYRNGDTWFDPFGNEIIGSPITQLQNVYGSGKPLQPYLQDPTVSIKSANYDVNKAFTDYKPRVNISPRISFSFPVDSSSLFYAHYDVVYQRPGGGSINTSPVDYFQINEGDKLLPNANLSPEKLVDYEVGFQQKLSSNSAITISTFYKERKDQIQIMQITGAYPNTYKTFGNKDFSTAKGMTAFYEIRDIKKLPLNLNFSYTLQFAEGTGSSTTSQNSLINSGQPNLRTILPLDFDSRHIFTVNAAYTIGNTEGYRGPKIAGVYPFKDMGVNLTMRARSGEPYTRLSRAVAIGDGTNPLSGSINGSRQAWNNNIDLRIDKDFTLGEVGRKPVMDGEAVAKPGNRRPLRFNAYAFIQNLLNTRNVLQTYGFTGNADDDGYVTSALGQLQASREINPLSWQDYYRMRLNDPANFVNPRRLFVGINVNF
jgi:hypothetical protein